MENKNVNRWFVVVAGVVILMCLGVAYSWGVFLVPIEKDTGWSRTQISFAVSILLLVFSIFMAIGGVLDRKLGPRKTATIGGLMVGLGWLLASFSGSPFLLYLFYGIFAGIGTGLSYMPSIASGIKWFPDKKGLVTGIIVFGFGFGTAFLSPLLTNLIANVGWRMTMTICGVVFSAIIILMAQFLRIPSSSSDVRNETSKDDVSFSPTEMIKTGSFKIMFLTYFISMIAGMMMIGHLVAFTIGKNFSAMQGAIALTVLAIFNGAGRIIFGYISDLWGGRKVLMLLFTLIGSAMFAMYNLNHLLLIYAVAGIIGLCFGGFLAVYPVLTAEYFGRQHFATNYGLVFIGYGIGCFTGPFVGGWVYDVAKNYLTAFYSAGVLAWIGAILIYFLLKKPIVGNNNVKL